MRIPKKNIMFLIKKIIKGYSKLVNILLFGGIKNYFVFVFSFKSPNVIMLFCEHGRLVNLVKY